MICSYRTLRKLFHWERWIYEPKRGCNGQEGRWHVKSNASQIARHWQWVGWGVEERWKKVLVMTEKFSTWSQAVCTQTGEQREGREMAWGWDYAGNCWVWRLHTTPGVTLLLVWKSQRPLRTKGHKSCDDCHPLAPAPVPLPLLQGWWNSTGIRDSRYITNIHSWQLLGKAMLWNPTIEEPVLWAFKDFDLGEDKT